ncbi:hypothetical protein [Streptomyces alfalfae]|nr:hypothetical protein [Streptomyces alfalfae]
MNPRLGVDPDEAFARLRPFARSRRQKFRLAAQIAQGPIPAGPDPAV